MAVELLRDSIYYQGKTKLLSLAVELAEVRNVNKLEKQITQGAKIHRLLQALDYDEYLTRTQRDRIVRTLVDVADINDFGVAPVLDQIDPPSIVVGVRGATGATGAAGVEGGGTPFSATAVTTDTICDSFAITESRGVEYTMNIYDDSGSDMRILRLQAGWNADGSSYADDGGIGQTIVGDCSGVSMSVIVSGTTVQLFATVTSGTWTIEGTRKYVPNNGNGIVNPTTLASGKIWVGNASNSPTAVTVSGDFTISTTGVGAIASGSIVNADVSGTASIAVSKLAALTASRAVVTDANGFLTVSAATATEVGYLSGVTSAIQTQLDSKIDSASGAISTVVSTDLTASRAVISNPSGKIAVSSVTSTELGYVSGVTSAIQTQINSRVADTGDTMTGALVNTSTVEAQGGIRTASSGDYFLEKTIDIGDWNMDSTLNVTVAHGIADFNKIRVCEVMIRDDANSQLYPVSNYSDDIGLGVLSANVSISRTIGGLFDSTDFNSTSFNRGFIYLKYIA